jgi:hypothetical protein
MAYVIYNRKDTALVTEKPFGRGSYKTLAAAKAARTRMIQRQKFAVDALLIAESNEYLNNIKCLVERTNLMTGKRYFEDVNTPSCCSPASETYWSM